MKLRASSECCGDPLATQTMELCSSGYESATDEDMGTIERKVEVQEDLRCNTREWDRGRKNSINYISLITGSPDHNCRPFFHFVCPIHRGQAMDIDLVSLLLCHAMGKKAENDKCPNYQRYRSPLCSALVR